MISGEEDIGMVIQIASFQIVDDPLTCLIDRSVSWEKQLSDWVRAKLLAGETNVLKQAMPQIESIMMNAALEHTAGRKAEAAELLGWGRNTLTRKLSQNP